jgi:GT2 family glycosyltransferase
MVAMGMDGRASKACGTAEGGAPAAVRATATTGADAREDPALTVVVITLGRESLYPLLHGVLEQETGFPFEVLLIANGPLDLGRLPPEGVRVVREEAGRGYSYYRNRGIAESRGRIVAYVDDDVTLPDRGWLRRLAGPIIRGEEEATTGGARIPLGQGYFADLVSLLGFPAGGALGWENVWPVDENGHTPKICTCNCAATREALLEVGGFDEGMVYGGEDVYLSEMLLGRGKRIRFVEDAYVMHGARDGFLDFVRWQVRRGRNVFEMKEAGIIRARQVGGRIKRTWIILRRVWGTGRFMPMLGVLCLEQACLAWGYAAQRAESRRGRARGARVYRQ